MPEFIRYYNLFVDIYFGRAWNWASGKDKTSSLNWNSTIEPHRPFYQVDLLTKQNLFLKIYSA